MKTIPLGKTGVEVSALCLGTMYFGSKNNPDTSFGLLDQYLEAGGTFLDTANAYARWVPGFQGGESETVLGDWLKDRGGRERLFIASKVGFPAPVDGLDFGNSAEQIQSACEASLKRMGIEIIDLYYSHADDRAVPLDERLEAFSRLVKAGKVRFVGASNIMDWRLEESRWLAQTNGWPQNCCVQQRYSYVRPRAGAIYDPHVVVTEDFLDYVRNRGLTILAYSPLLGGAYVRSDRSFPDQYIGPDTDARLSALRKTVRETGATANQVVLAWMLQTDPPVIPLIAASRTEHMAELLKAADLTLSEEHLERLSQAGNLPALHANHQRKLDAAAKRA